jgi:hypothetical protein
MLMVEDINNEIQRKRILETPRFGSRTDTVQSDFFSQPKQRGAQYLTSELVSSGESPH